jgi:hypothetical protein
VNPNSLRAFGILSIVLIGAALRLVPHPANFSPIGAMALFGGALIAGRGGLERTSALLLPLAALLLSDLVLGFHNTMPAVYVAFLIVGVIGIVLGPKASPVRLAFGSATGSIVFFVITNLAVWAQSGMYAKTGAGLAQCFVAAFPFFQNSLAGDLIYTAVLFGAWALVEKAVPRLRVA